MGHHRKGRESRRVDAVREDPRPAAGIGARDLEDLAEAARTARRTGWGFGAEVLASVDTRRVPTPPPRPADGLPRRYATHQPTAPIAVVRTA
jgi:hypothetical protein